MLAADAEAEMELQPETASFRKALLMRWQTLRDTGPDPGEWRALLSTLLTHAPVAAVVRFVTSNRAWRRGELDNAEAGAELVQCAYPRPTWSRTPALAKDAAADDTAWSAWIREWTAEISSTGPAAALALFGPRGTWVDQLRMKGEAMIDKKDALLAALSLGQMALDVYRTVNKHRNESGLGEAAPPVMTIESVMHEAQCHIPHLKDALAAFMGDREQISHCVDMVLENPDLLSLLNTLSGLRTTAPRSPPPAARAQAAQPSPPAPSPTPPATRAQAAQPSPPAPSPTPPMQPACPAQPDAEAPTRAMATPDAASTGPRSGPPRFRPEFLPRLQARGPAGDWAAAFSGTTARPAAHAAEPEAASGKADPPEVRDLQAAAPDPTPVPDPVTAGPTPADPSVAQALADLEHRVHERSRALRERGDRLAAQIEAFLATAGVSMRDRPAADARTGTNRPEPTPADTNDEHLPSGDIQAQIEQAEQRLEQAHNLDDEFLTWLEERFEAIPPEVRCPLEGSSSAA